MYLYAFVVQRSFAYLHKLQNKQQQKRIRIRNALNGLWKKIDRIHS